MSKTNKRLGRGLDSLLQTIGNDSELGAGSAKFASQPHDAPRNSTAPQIEQIRLDSVDRNPFQPRQIIDESSLESLAQSIKENGIVQPIVVRAKGERFELIAGERRYHAACRLGFIQIPAIVRDVDDEQMLELALIENIQREDLNAIDRAEAYNRYCKTFGATPEELGTKLGENRSTVVNYLRLLELPDQVRGWVASKQISMGHARALLGLKQPEAQIRLAKETMDGQLSVRQIEEIVRRSREAPQAAHKEQKPSNGSVLPQISYLEHCFEVTLKTKVRIHSRQGKEGGQIIVDFFNNEDFERLSALMGVPID